MSIDNPESVAEKVEHANSLTVQEAYDCLRDLAGDEGDTRDYLQQVFIHPAGWACATDAHVLGVVPVDYEGDEPVSLPVPDVHKTDAIEVTDDGIRVACGHKNDKSGDYEYMGGDFPDVSQVIPDHPSRELNEFSIKVDTSLIERLSVAITEDYSLHVAFTEDDGPILCRGEFGFGVVMPKRKGDEEPFDFPEEEE